MRTDTRIAFNAYTAHLASLNGVPAATDKFTIEPTVAQKLEDRIQENADFLRQVNVVPVDEMKAEILALGTNSPAANRTDTTINRRQPRYIGEKTKRGYECIKTDFDTGVKYQQLDVWAKFPDFQNRLRNHVTAQVARDRLTIGWHGTSAADEADLDTNPLLQDINTGWLQHIRTGAAQRVLDAIKIGGVEGADYRNLDAAVFDASNELLDPWHRRDTGIVVICGEGLVTDKYLGLINSDASDAPSEKAALATLLANVTLGNKRVITVPFFPDDALLITRPSNLSIYWQRGSHRRLVKDEPEYDRIVDYLSINEAYVVEDLGACALIEGILRPDGIGGWE